MAISIIIPAFNEQNRIAALVTAVLADEHVAEVIVADGRSTDHTAYRAAQAGAKVVRCTTRSRAFQLAAGAEEASSEMLYFLHADSTPPADFGKHIAQAAANGCAAGTFRLQFDSDHWLLTFYAWFSRFPWRVCRGGDASLFISR